MFSLFQRNKPYLCTPFSQLEVDTDIEKAKFNKGTEFIVPFFSCSLSFALKSSLKSHQMKTFFVQKSQ